MRYVSTRGEAPVLGFDDVLLAGLASDGGLYVPETWPQFAPAEIADFAGMPYRAVAARVMAPFVEGTIPAGDFEAMVADAYAGFTHEAVAPLTQIGDNDWLLELFHGPTLAFKDVAMQLLGRLFDYVLAKRRTRVTVVVATSGDTGPAAIEGCRGREAIDLFVLYPDGRVSDVQRRQMTTVADGNVFNIALQGTFDDCQAQLKAMFNDRQFRERHRISAVNSINWGRVMAQVVYYFTAAVALGAPHRPVAFTVPTGNFGDVFAGYAARRMGLQISQLVVGTNRNDILARFFRSGEYRIGAVQPTISPSMDIQVSSNFERLLFELCGRDGGAVRASMAELTDRRGFHVAADVLERTLELFDSCRVDEAETYATIERTLSQTGKLIDPHTAVGVRAAEVCRREAGVPMITLATAHPAKFPDAVERATGIRPALPPALADLFERAERFERLPNELAAIEAYIGGRASVTLVAEPSAP